MPHHAPVFGWSSPRPNTDGSTPAPWRVAHKAALEARLTAAGCPHAVAYVDYETVGGKQALYIGLRDNRDLSKHAANLERLGDVLEGMKLGKVKRVKRAGRLDYLLLIDTGAGHKKNPIRGAGVNARGGWRHVKGSGVWLARYASGPSYQIVHWNHGAGSGSHPFYQLDSGRWSTKADSFTCAALVGRYPTLSQAQQAAASERSRYKLSKLKNNPRNTGPDAFGPWGGSSLLPSGKPAPLTKEESRLLRKRLKEWDKPVKRANTQKKHKKNPKYDLDVGKVHVQTSRGVPGILAGILAAGFSNDAAAPAILKNAFVDYTGRPPKGYINVTFIIEGGDVLNSSNLPIEPTFTSALAERIVAKLSMHRDPVVQWEKR